MRERTGIVLAAAVVACGGVADSRGGGGPAVPSGRAGAAGAIAAGAGGAAAGPGVGGTTSGYAFDGDEVEACHVLCDAVAARACPAGPQTADACREMLGCDDGRLCDAFGNYVDCLADGIALQVSCNEIDGTPYESLCPRGWNNIFNPPTCGLSVPPPSVLGGFGGAGSAGGFAGAGPGGGAGHPAAGAGGAGQAGAASLPPPTAEEADLDEDRCVQLCTSLVSKACSASEPSFSKCIIQRRCDQVWMCDPFRLYASCLGSGGAPAFSCDAQGQPVPDRCAEEFDAYQGLQPSCPAQ